MHNSSDNHKNKCAWLSQWKWWCIPVTPEDCPFKLCPDWPESCKHPHTHTCRLQVSDLGLRPNRIKNTSSQKKPGLLLLSTELQISKPRNTSGHRLPLHSWGTYFFLLLNHSTNIIQSMVKKKTQKVTAGNVGWAKWRMGWIWKKKLVEGTRGDEGRIIW